MSFLSSHDVLIKYLSDMCAAESHLLESLKSQQSSPVIQINTGVGKFIGELQELTKGHLKGLHVETAKFDAGLRTSFKESLTAMTGVAMGAASKLRIHSAAKMLRDDYVLLNMNAIGYTMLHTTGLALGSAEVAGLALRFLKETTPFIMQLSQLVIPVVVEELKATSRVDSAAPQAALENVRIAWMANA